MNTNTLSTLQQSPASLPGKPVTGTAAQGTPESSASFGSKLAHISDQINKYSSKNEETKAREEAEEAAAGLVSNALILPILKQIRRSTFGENTVLSGGIGEKTFGPQFDMQLADRIAHSPRLGVKNVLANRLLKRGSPAATPAKNAGLDVNG